jgi:hypothetical protein
LGLENQQFLFNARPFAYVLNDDYSVRPSCSYEEITASFKDDRRFLLRDEVGDILVSTVFLVIAHPHFSEDAFDLFETAIIDGDYVEIVYRYATYEEAVSGHKVVVSSLINNSPLKKILASDCSICPLGTRMIRVPKL